MLTNDHRDVERAGHRLGNDLDPSAFSTASSLLIAGEVTVDVHASIKPLKKTGHEKRKNPQKEEADSMLGTITGSSIDHPSITRWFLARLIYPRICALSHAHLDR